MNFQKNLYQKFIEKKLPLNDQLAAARSILANERTFLSYQRTAITLFIAGLSFVKFFDAHWIIIIGWIFMPVSIVTIFLGIFRYVRMSSLIKNIEHESFIFQENNSE
ncbi:MAG: DUF202 domain-containing protein [bacterium]